MPTSRSGSAAVHIPAFGVLVVGGWSKCEVLKTALRLERRRSGGAAWRAINPMIKPRHLPSAAYFQERVFVAGGRPKSTVEVLSLHSGEPGQWTVVATHSSPYAFMESMCDFNGTIVVAGNLIRLKIVVNLAFLLLFHWAHPSPRMLHPYL